MFSGYDSNVEGGNFGASGGRGFSDKAIRRGFIRKVYGILSLQLMVTLGIIMLFTHVEGLRLYARRNRWMYWTGFATTMVSVILDMKVTIVTLTLMIAKNSPVSTMQCVWI